MFFVFFFWKKKMPIFGSWSTGWETSSLLVTVTFLSRSSRCTSLKQTTRLMIVMTGSATLQSPEAPQMGTRRSAFKMSLHPRAKTNGTWYQTRAPLSFSAELVPLFVQFWGWLDIDRSIQKVQNPFQTCKIHTLCLTWQTTSDNFSLQQTVKKRLSSGGKCTAPKIEN